MTGTKDAPMTEEFDYVVCMNCESPCYVFEIDAKGRVTSAYCQICANDDPAEFRPPDVEELDSDS
jgi:hypothetical protein